MTQAFPIALFQHPLLLTLRAFHVLFGTDRKPFHCFTTWILTLMKEMLHLITEPLKRAPFPNGLGDTAFLRLTPAQHTRLGQSQHGQHQLPLGIPAGSDLTSGCPENELFSVTGT